MTTTREHQDAIRARTAEALGLARLRLAGRRLATSVRLADAARRGRAPATALALPTETPMSKRPGPGGAGDPPAERPPGGPLAPAPPGGPDLPVAPASLALLTAQEAYCWLRALRSPEAPLKRARLAASHCKAVLRGIELHHEYGPQPGFLLPPLAPDEAPPAGET